MNYQVHDFSAFGTGVRIATLAGLDAAGRPLVGVADQTPIPARSLVPVERDMTGREVAVVPISGDPCLLLILGVIQPPLLLAGDGTCVIEAERELVLRCGKSSLTLTGDGRVTVRGKQILSRAEGQNRVQGASVQLN